MRSNMFSLRRTEATAAPGTRAAAAQAPAGSLAQAALNSSMRWAWWEYAFIMALISSWFVLPNYALLGNEIVILALFALSLDLILGYAGIVSLGHAAFFGTGAYAAALFAKHVMPDPLVGLLVGSCTAAVLGLVTSPLVLRGTDLTRLMVTLGVAGVLLELANKFDEITGGADGLQGVAIGALLGRFEFDIEGHTAWAYTLVVLVVALLVCRRIVHSPFGMSLKAIRDNKTRASAMGIHVNARLVAVYTFSALLAGAAGSLLAQTTGFVSLDVLEFHRSADVMLVVVIGGAGWLWGGVVGAIAFKLLYDVIAGITPQYWTFWLGLFLVILTLVGRDRLFRPWTWFGARQ